MFSSLKRFLAIQISHHFRREIQNLWLTYRGQDNHPNKTVVFSHRRRNPFCAGALIDINLDSPELIGRTDIGLDSLVLALASGAAAALSLASGLSGVMVAVALLPPSVAIALFLGAGEAGLAGHAAILLAAKCRERQYRQPSGVYSQRRTPADLAGKAVG